MRIEAYNAVSQIYQANKTTNVKRAGSAYAVNDNDRLEFSDVAKVYQTAKTAVSKAPDVRADKVAEIKAAMEGGTYKVSSEAIADKLVGNLSAIVF